jgi:hypothetical protein
MTYLTYPGDAVKALEGGKIEGYLVRFGSPDDHDVQGDYFTPETYFGKACKAGLDMVYHHGLARDPAWSKLGNEIIGDVTIETRQDGLYAHGALDLARDGVPDLWRDIQAGKVGWSSGSTDRLVKRTDVKAGVRKVERWPLIEASVSHRPVDARNTVHAVKALTDQATGDVGTVSLVDSSEALVARAQEIEDQFRKAVDLRQSEGRNLSEPKRETLRMLSESFASMYDATRPRPSADDVRRVRLKLLASRLA